MTLGAVFTLALALAEGGESPWVHEAARAVNVGIFAVILFLLLRKPMASFFDARVRQIKADLDRARREKAEAEEKLAEVEKRLANLDADAARIRAEAEVEAEAEHARVLARTEEEVRKIAETTDREVGAALKIARADIQRFVAEQAVVLAEARIRTEMTEEDRKRMLDQYAAQLQEVKK